MKYKITQDDVDRGRAKGGGTSLGISTTTTTSTVGLSTTFDLEENQNYIQMPPSVIGVNQIFKIRSDTVYDGLFNICLLYTSPSPRDGLLSRMPSSA